MFENPKIQKLSKKNKIYSFLNGSIFIVWSSIAGLISIMLLFSAVIDYNRKQDFLLPNWLLLCGGFLVLALFVFLNKKMNIFNNKRESVKEILIYYLTVALFLASVYIVNNIYFTSGWDSNIIIDNSWKLAFEEYESCNAYYYSNYPNNLFITWIYSKLIKLNSLFGDSQKYQLFIAHIQALLMSVTGLILFKIVKSISKIEMAYMAWIVFAIHIGLSPWICIVYTDATGMILPLLILYLYLKTQNGKLLLLKWFSIGGLTYFGYRIKPQIIIVGIAILIVELINLCKFYQEKSFKHCLKNYILCCLAFVIAATFYCNVILPSIKIEIDSNKSFSLVHYIKMGLNSETDGAYLSSDVEFSRSCDTQEQRQNENLKVIKKRIKEYGTKGLVKHTIKKTLVTFGDGTYAWSREGNFYNKTINDINEYSSPILKSVFYEKGKYYKKFITFQQFIWVNILFLSLGIGFYYFYKKNTNPVVNVAVLSLIGLTAFCTIFEARARYLFIYSPFFIIVAMLGLLGFISCLRNIKKHNKEKKI